MGGRQGNVHNQPREVGGKGVGKPVFLLQDIAEGNEQDNGKDAFGRGEEDHTGLWCGGLGGCGLHGDEKGGKVVGWVLTHHQETSGFNGGASPRPAILPQWHRACRQ